jgi:hypothetical protein
MYVVRERRGESSVCEGGAVKAQPAIKIVFTTSFSLVIYYQKQFQ